MNHRSFIISALSLSALTVYLFVSAPAPLPEDKAQLEEIMVPIETVLATVAAENDHARTLYTKELVGRGPAVGLMFDEHWREESVQAGPLPALFLREAAASIRKSKVPLGLFLGSDFPISPSNRFEGRQAEVFEEMKQTRETVTFYAEDTQLYTTMVPDYAGVSPCVSCHNLHEQSPKTDWVLGDMMGATTWTYPKAEVGMSEYLDIITAVRQGFRDGYAAYLAEAATFDTPPEVGERWPEEGYHLPSEAVFFAEFDRRSAPGTVAILLSLGAVEAEQH